MSCFNMLRTTSMGFSSKPGSDLNEGHYPTSLQMSSLQMNNKMFVTKTVLEKQVDIMRNPRIPEMLKNQDNYVYRHMGNSLYSTNTMLSKLGYKTLDEFIEEVVPDSIKLQEHNYFKHDGKELNGIRSEALLLERMRQLADNNIVNKSLIG